MEQERETHFSSRTLLLSVSLSAILFLAFGVHATLAHASDSLALDREGTPSDMVVVALQTDGATADPLSTEGEPAVQSEEASDSSQDASPQLSDVTEVTQIGIAAETTEEVATPEEDGSVIHEDGEAQVTQAETTTPEPVEPITQLEPQSNVIVETHTQADTAASSGSFVPSSHEVPAPADDEEVVSDVDVSLDAHVESTNSTEAAEVGPLEFANASLAFTPRTTAPDTSNKWYYSDLNLYYAFNPGLVGQCTWYAFGRASEILGTPYHQSYNGDAGLFWNHNTDFPADSTPRVGSIACCGRADGAGHVAVVEAVLDDGSFYLSEFYGGSDQAFHYNGPYSDPQDWADRNRGGYVFQGFIHLIDEDVVTPSDNPSHGETNGTTIGNRTFVDCSPDAWYVTEGWLKYVVSNGIMTGNKDANGNFTGYFDPDASVSRGQIATIIYRCANPNSVETTDPLFYGQTTSFEDVPTGYYYTAAIEWCRDLGIVTGYKDESGNATGKFGPEDPVTREQLAAMVYRYTLIMGHDMECSDSEFAAMPDVSDVTGFAVTPLTWCVANGVITGDKSFDPAHLNPQGEATRAQAAKILTVTLRIIFGE